MLKETLDFKMVNFWNEVSIKTKKQVKNFKLKISILAKFFIYLNNSFKL